MKVIERIVDFFARHILRDVYLDGFANEDEVFEKDITYRYKSIYPNEVVRNEVERIMSVSRHESAIT